MVPSRSARGPRARRRLPAYVPGVQPTTRTTCRCSGLWSQNGYVATDLNAYQGLRTVAQGAAIIARLATLPAGGPTGGFFDDAGAVPW